ncbi:MAG TPA: sodium:solute symporter [Terriglobales bacterium]|nr:sodium:solute symporter [Terriglobales bacterium]
MAGVNAPATAVFAFFIVLVAVVGFFSGRWRSGDLGHIEEWGLAGRQFGTVVSWFLIGGDFYTAYTLIAVPALVFGVGASGFFALVYTIIVYPFVFLVMPRLWNVSKRHNYVTLADFAQGRYGSHWLALAIAISGILATMPYIALQLVGMQVSIAALGFGNTAWPLVAAFLILAAFDYTSGMRAPATISLIKGVMVYGFVLAAVVWVPLKLGGYAHIFHVAARTLALRPKPGFLILPHGQFTAFATLALGSALAAFLYPHTATSVLSSSSGTVIRRNAVLLPAYTFLLGLLALLGYMAIAAGVSVHSTNDVVPALFLKLFPSWFAGFCFAAIAVGGLVPAAIMSIASSNLFTRNIYRPYLRPALGRAEEARVAKLVSLLIKFGALAFVLWGNATYVINLQLLGGIWILQTLPAIVFGLFRRWFHPLALVVGWLAGMAVGTSMAWSQGIATLYPLHIAGFTFTAYAAIDALALNLGLALLLTPLLRRLGFASGHDQTQPADYEDPVPALAGAVALGAAPQRGGA